MTVALAQAMTPSLVVADADPAGDADALARLAVWALRYAPIAAPDPPDGLVVDVDGAAHLFGGEGALIADLTTRLERAGYAARAAVADSAVAAWGLARFAPPGTDGPAGSGLSALAPLPVEALRLDAETAAALRALGFERVADLAAAHRPSLSLRFGPEIGRRLDQARGITREVIEPVRAPETPHARLAFTEPLMHSGGLGLALRKLADALCADLETRGLGACRLDLLLQRVDGASAAVRVGASRPTRDPAHIVRLFGERLDAVDPGFGVEAASLAATRAQPFGAHQAEVRGLADEDPSPDIAPLVDVIAGRIGARRLYRLAPVESDIPERSERQVSPLHPPLGRSWEDGPRPALFLPSPEPVEVLALLPDYPPRFFTWRARRIDVARADGPERVHGEWWLSDAEVWLTRDYFRVEGGDGLRYWLFRASTGPEGGGDARWFLQGAFG